MNTLKELQNELKVKADIEKAAILQRFFKTDPGEYGAGDIFLGITVPELRKLAKKYQDLQLVELETLINSLIHEERLITLLILLNQYKQVEMRKAIYDFYVANMQYINNWDLVDLSAPHIVGHFLWDKEKMILQKWAQDKNLWKRRIAIVSTFYFIRQNIYQNTLDISAILLNDKEDLIHKAVGWMLREVGNRDMQIEEKFLKKHYKTMPRTMLRYAIERFPEQKRQAYLREKFNKLKKQVQNHENGASATI